MRLAHTDDDEIFVLKIFDKSKPENSDERILNFIREEIG